MNRFLKRSLCTVLTVGLLAAISVWLTDVGLNALRPNTDVSLTGNTPSIIYKARYLNHVDPNKPVRVVVGLKLRDQAGLDALLKAQRDPSSPEFRHFLTPEQFRARFGPTAADIATAKSYFTSRGLKVDEAASSNAVIVLEGTSGTAEAAFKVRLNTYAVAGVAGIADGDYISNNQDPSVPSSLTNIVESISGLSDFSQYHSRAVRNSAAPQSTPSGYSPQEIATAYDFPTTNNAHATVKYSGKGYTVAIATAYGYKQSDVDAYWKHWGITRTGTVTNVAVNGQTTKTDDETTLDLETVGAQAPGANIIMYIGADPAYRTFTMIFNQIVSENKADVISVSWGSCEAHEGWAQMRTESAIFRQAAAQGIAVFSSSGDDGAYDCGGKSRTYAVDYPSADPNVTAVGGTSLHLKDGKRTSEEAWRGAGGGESDNFGRPDWQVGNGVPSHGWFGWFDKRLSADVAMNADPYTGYAIYVDDGWIQIGGTSVSAPDWAAVWILATEANGGRLGSAAPTIWRLANTPDYPNVFVDITKGNNGAGKGPGFKSGPGFDHPTGWGVPNVTALVKWLHDDFHQGCGH